MQPAASNECKQKLQVNAAAITTSNIFNYAFSQYSHFGKCEVNACRILLHATLMLVHAGATGTPNNHQKNKFVIMI
jgi:hypothetical protein